MASRFATIFILLFSTWTSFGQNSFMNVSVKIKEVRCITQSGDDIFELDGRGDEIMVDAYGMVLNPQADTVRTFKYGSSITGDVSKHLATSSVNFFNNATNMASGSPYFFSGMYTPFKPLYGEGNVIRVDSGQAFVFTTTVSEMDNMVYFIPLPGESNGGGSQRLDYLRDLPFNKRKSALDLANSTAVGTLQVQDVDLVGGMFSGGYDIFGNGIFPNSWRPIGFGQSSPTSFRLNEKALALSWANLYHVATHDLGKGMGNMEAVFDFNEYDYVPWSKVDRAYYRVTYSVHVDIPKQIVKLMTPMFDPKLLPIIRRYTPLKAINPMTKSVAGFLPGVLSEDVFLGGKWIGALGAGVSSSGLPVALEVGTKGKPVVVSLPSDSKGSYQTFNGEWSITSGTLNISFKDARGWLWRLTSSGYSAATNEITGTWTCLANGVESKGSWLVKK